MRNATPVAVTPMIYSTDMALVVISMTSKSSLILSGQLTSDILNPALNSAENTFVGSNANGALRLEQLVTFSPPSPLFLKFPSQYVKTCMA